MAIFSNQATLTYNGSTTNSNIAYGEILDVLAVTKTAVEGSYTPGQLVTYAVTLRNTGNVPLTGLAVTDTFDPILSALAVTFDGVTWTQGVQYNYNGTTGLFETVPGQILVPAAAYTQDPATGTYTAASGIATLVVTGTI